jgi:signal transduction histidine kinase
MIARAEAGEAREGMADFDVSEVARSVAELYEPLAEEKNMHLSADTAGPLKIHGNRELVGQALANLLDNAIKYGSAESGGNEIRIATGRDDGHVLISVADHGAGIAPADRGRAVERFVRLETSRSKPGAGLGLSLVSAVAHLHGGELRLDDNAPGLRVTLVFPAVPERT